jgi:hypothetical protein
MKFNQMFLAVFTANITSLNNCYKQGFPSISKLGWRRAEVGIIPSLSETCQVPRASLVPEAGVIVYGVR